ncbi:MAG: imelysin family protein [Flavobacteriales bacterium]
MKSYKLLFLAGAISIGSLMTSCKNDDDSSKTSSSSVKQNYAKMVAANYADALSSANDLKTAINAFTTTPNAQTHQAAKDAWITAREPYGLTEVYRFWAGPIDDDNGPEGALNAWPLNENFIDYVYNPTTHTVENNGLIGDATFNLTISSIVDQNESVDEKSISIGYHAIEFLLWGQDFNMAPGTTTPDYSLSGQRSHTDFSTDALAERRKTYLKLITDQLITDLTYLVDAWKDNNAWGRKAFLAQSDDQALTDMFNGMGKLAKGELAGERMFVALSNKDQEDEHSCFSDNTHRDIVQNYMGIKNVWEGTYGTINGSSIRDLIQEKNSVLATTIDEKFTTTTELVNKINTQKPFDELISSGNTAGNKVVMDALVSLQELGDLLVESAASIGITFVADLEE